MKRRGELKRQHSIEAIPPYDPRSRHYDRFTTQEYKFERDTAQREWKTLRAAILAEGGIRPARGSTGKLQREDISGIPPSLIRYNSRFTVDQFASWYGYEYDSDFENFVETVHENALRTKAAPKRPRKMPKIKHSRHGRRRLVSITRKPHPVPKAASTKVREDKSKWVYVRKHTRSCPK